MSMTRGLKFRSLITSSVGILALLGWLTLTPFIGSAAEEEAEVPPTNKPKSAKLPASTHVQMGQIKIEDVHSGHQLQTFCLGKDDLIFAIVGPPRPYTSSLEGEANASEIRVHDGDGKEVRQWKVPFAAQSIAAASDGTIHVAGNGMIAKYDPIGMLLSSAKLPHLAVLLKNSEKLKEQAEAQLEEDKEQYEIQLRQFTQQTKRLTERLESQKKKLDELTAKLEEKPKDTWTAEDERKLRRLKTTVEKAEASSKQSQELLQANSQLDFYKKRSERTVNEVIAAISAKLGIVNALAVSDKDVFVASGVLKGYAYSIWRTGHDYQGAEEIVTGLSGCCGQMDIRCCDDCVFVAENSRKRVLQFDRDGKKLRQWGEGARDGVAGAGFGGCCNPMNLSFSSSGEVLTAESEGIIKRFSKEGKFQGIVGTANVAGGCKNVALDLSSNGEKAYFLDRTGSQIVVLTRKAADEKVTTTTRKKVKSATSE